MNVEIKEIGPNRNEMQITIPQADVDKAAGDVYRDIAKNVNIKGFRKGKAPKSVIRSYYGDYIDAELSKKLINEKFEQALEEEQVFIVSAPEFESDAPKEGEDFTFKASFDVRPEVKAEKFTGFELKQLKKEVGDEDVDGVIEHLQSNLADVKEVEDADYAAQTGDYVVVDIDSADEPDLKREQMTVEAGGKSVIPGVADNLEGLKAGETKEIEGEFPEDHFMEQMRGKTVKLNVKVVSIKQKELPELNDEFAKKVRPDVEGMDALREAIRKDFQDRAEQEVRASLEKQVSDELVKANQFDVPQSMIEMQANMMMQEVAQRFAAQGMQMQDLFSDMESFRAESMESAENVVRVSLLVDAISKELELEVSDEDVDAEIAKMAEQYQVSAEMIKQNIEERGARAEIEFGVKQKKVFDYIVENSNVEEVDSLDEAEEE